MSKLMIKIHNTETGEIIEREMNAEELAQIKADELELTAKIEAEAKAEAAKSAAQAKLAALGLTAEDLKALGL
jgi:hypothetical protein